MVLQQLVRSILEFPGMFVDIAMQGPIPALLVIMGAVLVGIPVALLGVLAVLWIGSALTPSPEPSRPRAE